MGGRWLPESKNRFYPLKFRSLFEGKWLNPGFEGASLETHMWLYVAYCGETDDQKSVTVTAGKAQLPQRLDSGQVRGGLQKNLIVRKHKRAGPRPSVVWVPVWQCSDGLCQFALFL